MVVAKNVRLTGKCILHVGIAYRVNRSQSQIISPAVPVGCTYVGELQILSKARLGLKAFNF